MNKLKAAKSLKTERRHIARIEEPQTTEPCVKAKKGQGNLPRIRVEATPKGDPRTICLLHTEIQNENRPETVGEAMLALEFGVKGNDAAQMILRQVINATRTQEDISEAEVNGTLALLAGMVPRDECEAMLLAQMTANHNLIMELFRRVRNTVETLPQQDSNGGLLNRLQRTYAAQVEALSRYRNRGQQTVRVVHQHVQVAANNAQVNVGPPSDGGEG